MLSQVVTNQVGQHRGARQEEAETSRIREFLRMNPPSFTYSSTTEVPENFVEKMKKVFDMMHVSDAERVELDAHQLKIYLGLGLISGRREEMRMHHVRVCVDLKKIYKGVSFLEN